MRVGMAGLNALYWPLAFGGGLARFPGVDFVAAATLGTSPDVIQANLGMTPAEYAARYGLKLYELPEDMIHAEHLDTIVLISRHSHHADWVERLAPLGVNFFIPKTFATTLSEADRIVQTQRRYGVRIAAGPSARFLAPMRAVKAAIDSGLIGQPFSLRLCHHHGTIDVFGRNDWYRDPHEGGPELSLGWYGIDLAQFMLSDQVKTVGASYGNFTSPDSPFLDCGRIVMMMRRGAFASFDMYFCNRFAYPAWQLELIGDKGALSLRPSGQDPSQTILVFEDQAGSRALPITADGPHWEMFWRDELLAGQRPTIDAADARQITMVSLAARDAAGFGKVVAIPEE
jgi:predicted dehydrogenase